MRVERIFFLIGTIILVGFIARILFERTRIPDVLIWVKNRFLEQAARYWLKNPREVQKWLADLCRARQPLNATEGGA